MRRVICSRCGGFCVARLEPYVCQHCRDRERLAKHTTGGGHGAGRATLPELDALAERAEARLPLFAERRPAERFRRLTRETRRCHMRLGD